MHEKMLPVLEGSPLFKFFCNNAETTAVQIMDKDGYIVYTNKAFEKAFGYTTHELYGKHSRVLFTEEDQKRLLPEMEIAKVNQLGAATDRNYTIHKDGSCIWVTGESTLVKDENGHIFLAKVIHNIHEQKLLEKFLKESQEFLESVIKSISDALLVIDPELKIVKANNTFYNFFNINNVSVEGLCLSDLDDPLWSSNELRRHLQLVISTGASNEFQLEWKGPNQQQSHLSVKARMLDGKLADKKILLVITDITDRVQSEQHRDDILSFVIHELRNPLANISLCTELMEQSLEENNKEEALEFLQKTKTNAARLNALISELFDAMRAGAGNMQFNKQQFDFEDMVQEAIESVQLTRPSHSIERQGEARVQVFADRDRLLQVLGNYLINAIKYSPKADKIDLHISMEAGNVVVAVTDYGEGIAAHNIPVIFNRYYRVDKNIKTEGLGLGLYLARQIIHAHAGRVWVESTEGAGSTFYFSIPV